MDDSLIITIIFASTFVLLIIIYCIYHSSKSIISFFKTFWKKSFFISMFNKKIIVEKPRGKRKIIKQ